MVEGGAAKKDEVVNRAVDEVEVAVAREEEELRP